MSDFYQLSAAQQAEKLEGLARAALPLWGIPSDASLALLKYRENAVFRIETPDNHVALRLHRAGYHSDDALRSELQWMKALDHAGIRTPKIIPASDGESFKVLSVDEVPEPRQVDLWEWIDGKPLGTIEDAASADADATLQNFRMIGALMAEVHNHAQHWQRPEGFTRQAWDLDGLLGDNPTWGRFWELELLSPEQRDLVLRAREKARTELEAFGTDSDRFGLIHCDFLPENCLATEEGVQLIDFDDSGFGWHMFDIATSLFHFGDHEQFAEITDALIAGYESKRELSEDQLTALPLFFVLRGLTYMGWMHTRSEMETAQELGPIVLAAVMEIVANYLGEGANHS